MREPWLQVARTSRSLNDWQTAYWAAAKALAVTEKLPSSFGDGEAWGAPPHDELALAAHNLGHDEQAVAEGEKALSLDPDNSRLKSNLEWYYKRVRLWLAIESMP